MVQIAVALLSPCRPLKRLVAIARQSHLLSFEVQVKILHKAGFCYLQADYLPKNIYGETIFVISTFFEQHVQEQADSATWKHFIPATVEKRGS